VRESGIVAGEILVARYGRRVVGALRNVAATRALCRGERVIGAAYEELTQLVQRVRPQWTLGVARDEGRQLLDRHAACGIVGVGAGRHRAIQGVLRA
jgi:hypothetical protein